MLVALISASGSPGVSTTALGLTLTAPTPRVLLVEADPIGGSPVHAGFLRGTREAAAARSDRSLINLVDPARRGSIADAFGRQVVAIPTDDPDTDAWCVPGLRTTGQADAMRDTWAPLGSHLNGLARRGATVVVDAGRYGHRSGPEDLIRQADLVIVLTRTSMTAVEVLCGTLHSIRDLLRRHKSPSALGLITIGDTPYTPGEVSKAAAVPLISALPDSPHSAVFADGSTLGSWRRSRSGYLRNLEKTWTKMHTFIESNGPDWFGGPDAGGPRALT